MIDLRRIRENPDKVKEALRSLQAEAPIDEIIVLDETRRRILQELEDLRHERNVTSKEIGRMKEAAEREELIEKMGAVNERIKELETRLQDFMAYFDPKGGISDVPLGPFERAKQALKGE